MQNLEDVQKIIYGRNWSLTGYQEDYNLYLAPFIGWDKIIAKINVKNLEDILKIYESNIMPKYGVNDRVKVKIHYASGWQGSTHDCHEWVEGEVIGIYVHDWKPITYDYYVKHPKRSSGVYGRYTVNGRTVQTYKKEDSLSLIGAGLDSIESEEPTPTYLLRKDLMYKQIKKIPRFLDEDKLGQKKS